MMGICSRAKMPISSPANKLRRKDRQAPNDQETSVFFYLPEREPNLGHVQLWRTPESQTVEEHRLEMRH